MFFNVVLLLAFSCFDFSGLCFIQTIIIYLRVILNKNWKILDRDWFSDGLFVK